MRSASGGVPVDRLVRYGPRLALALALLAGASATRKRGERRVPAGGTLPAANDRIRSRRWDQRSPRTTRERTDRAETWATVIMRNHSSRELLALCAAPFLEFCEVLNPWFAMLFQAARLGW